jgi:hypothetical protein
MFIKLEIAPQTTVDSLSILVNHIGFPSLKQIKIDSKDINIVLGGAFTQMLISPDRTKNLPTPLLLPDPIKK